MRPKRCPWQQWPKSKKTKDGWRLTSTAISLSNVESQGVKTKDLVLSGLFSNTEERFFGPEEIPQSDFNPYFTKHVNIMKFASPFISTFKYPLAPVHRAHRTREGTIISIVDSSRLQTEVYSAPGCERIRQTSTDIGVSGGVGEYLIWGIKSQRLQLSTRSLGLAFFFFFFFL